MHNFEVFVFTPDLLIGNPFGEVQLLIQCSKKKKKKKKKKQQYLSKADNDKF